MSEQKRSPLFIIILTVFIDMLGVTIIIPVIPSLFFEGNTAFFDPSFPEDSRSLLYGFLIACYPIMQFFGAPILGSLSDRFGRKPVLQISIVGSIIGYLLFGYAIVIKNIYLLFFARLLPGFMGGNISVVKSSIADISDDESKAKNFGLVGAAFGIGFILGPAIGGLLADSSVVSWFDHATPFWFTAILATINFILIYSIFPETLKEKTKGKVSAFTGLRNIATSFQSPNLRVIFTVVLLLSLGFAFYTQFFSVLLLQKFDYTEKSIGFLYGWIGLWLALTQGLIVRRMSGKVDSKKVLSFSIFAVGIGVLVLLIPENANWFYIINPFIAIAYGLTSPNMTTVISNQASAAKQGEVLGIHQSVLSIGAAVPPLIAGYLNTLNENYPLLAGSVFIISAGLVFVFVFQRDKQKVKV